MSAAPAIRVNYFDRQFIRLAELRDEQAYHLQHAPAPQPVAPLAGASSPGSSWWRGPTARSA